MFAFFFSLKIKALVSQQTNATRARGRLGLGHREQRTHQKVKNENELVHKSQIIPRTFEINEPQISQRMFEAGSAEPYWLEEEISDKIERGRSTDSNSKKARERKRKRERDGSEINT